MKQIIQCAKPDDSIVLGEINDRLLYI